LNNFSRGIRTFGFADIWQSRLPLIESVTFRRSGSPVGVSGTSVLIAEVPILYRRIVVARSDLTPNQVAGFKPRQTKGRSGKRCGLFR
jgi:hypothetical protein